MESTTALYVPPEGLRFRLVGYVSQCAIFSRNRPDPQVWHYNVSHGEYPDQWFTLLHGTGDHKGLYAIKGQVTGKVLFSRHQKPTVGHIDGNGKYKDNWFKLEPGSGQHTSYFRLITPSEQLTLFSRVLPEPTFGNHPEKSFFPDQLFRFIWEGMKVDKIDFNFDAGKILWSTPLTLGEQVFTNNSDTEQELNFKVKKSVTNSCTFEYGGGFPVAVGMEFHGGIPTITDGKFKLDASVITPWFWAKTTSYTIVYNNTFPVKVAPFQSIRATSLVNQGMLEVPFTMHLSSTSAGVKVQTTGTWRGLSSWDLRHTISDLVGHEF